MDIEKMGYIFGSFVRRRTSREPSGAKRRPTDQTKKISEDKFSLHQPKKQMVAFQRTKTTLGTSFDDAKFRCSMCKKQFDDPRVLPCLHTFCLKCLEQLERTDFSTWKDDSSDTQKTDSSSGSRKPSSAGSGYVSERPEDLSLGKTFYCPSCGSCIDLPVDGVAGFTPNYILQHKIILANMNPNNDNLCDVCTSDKSVTFRCIDCSLNLCDVCEEVHQRQKVSAEHKISILEQSSERGTAGIKRPLMCLKHPDMEITMFCSSCYEVICKDCVSTFHRDHICEPITKAVKNHFTKLRLLADRAKDVVEECAVASSKLNATSKKVEMQCTTVQNDVEKFIEEYIQSVENHKLGLLDQIKEVREEKLQNISQEKLKLQKKLRDARDVSYFLSDLLTEGTDGEILTYLKTVLNKIENCGNFETTTDLKLSGSLQFLREETVKCPNNFFTIYGVLTTQSVSPDNCFLNTAVLQNLRVSKRVEILLETRDFDDMPIGRGGEGVIADIRHRDAGGSKSLAVQVKDKRNGTYIISFVPDVPGKLVLDVVIKGQPVKGSPFPINVRTIKQHTGLYHCCTFCSSRGNKEATCGCPGEMPGGYKGCGHGHEGHPGRRHWSCCGNILEHSECTRIK